VAWSARICFFVALSSAMIVFPLGCSGEVRGRRHAGTTNSRPGTGSRNRTI
jgi:hypothetical protein